MLTGQRTVPSVWIGGMHVGGNDDVQGLNARGELQAKLGGVQREMGDAGEVALRPKAKR